MDLDSPSPPGPPESGNVSSRLKSFLERIGFLSRNRNLDPLRSPERWVKRLILDTEFASFTDAKRIFEEAEVALKKLEERLSCAERSKAMVESAHAKAKDARAKVQEDLAVDRLPKAQSDFLLTERANDVATAEVKKVNKTVQEARGVRGVRADALVEITDMLTAQLWVVARVHNAQLLRAIKFTEAAMTSAVRKTVDPDAAGRYKAYLDSLIREQEDLEMYFDFDSVPPTAAASSQSSAAFPSSRDGLGPADAVQSADMVEAFLDEAFPGLSTSTLLLRFAAAHQAFAAGGGNYHNGGGGEL